MKKHVSRYQVSRPALLALATVIAAPLPAADISWSATDGDFNVAANWTGGVIPADGDTALVANGGTLHLTDARTVGGIGVPDGIFINAGQMLTALGSVAVGGVSGDSGQLELDNGLLFANGTLSVGTGGGTGTLYFPNGFISRAGTGEFLIGEGNGSSGELSQFSGFINCMTPWEIGSGTGATGLYDFSGLAAANAHDWFIVGADGGSGTLQIGGSSSLNKLNTIPDTHAVFGRGNGSTATITQTGGLFVNVLSDTRLGESGNATATWTLDGLGAQAVFSTLILGYEGSASGTFHLNAGTLTASRIIAGSSTGTSTLYLNGGTFKPGSNDGDLISGLTAVRVSAGGAIFDTSPPAGSENPFVIGIYQDLLDDGGGLVKRGTGMLIYQGIGSYTGLTTVEGGELLVNGELTVSDVSVLEAGTLGGSGVIGSSVTAAGTIAPGDGPGTLTVEEDVILTGTLAAEVSDFSTDVLAVTGDLNVEGATLHIELPSGPPTSGSYVIATYGTRSGGNFAAITGITGYTVDYAYEGNQIAIVPGGSPYDTWAAGITWESPADSLAIADPDGDGILNELEFFTGGDPLSGIAPAGYPAGKVEDGRFIFTFLRSTAAAAVPPVVEYGTGLDDLTNVAADGIDDVTIVTAAVASGELWTVSFPLPPGGKLFARLRVTIP